MTAGVTAAASPAAELEALLDALGPRTLFEALRDRFGPCELLSHWKQGEFHHDLIFRLPTDTRATLGPVLAVSTNCNGGVKELLSLADAPARWALWHDRCPDNPAFEGRIPPVLARARTMHFFDPCLLLEPDARSELREDSRQRQRGGGWIALDSDEESEADWLAARG